MRLSTRGRYAVRAMLDLATHPQNGPVSLQEVAERIGVSAKYLDQILSRMRNAGLVRAVRGAKGGFTLSKDPSATTLLEILRVVEGPIAVVECVQTPSLCERAKDCVAREVWAEVGRAIEGVLGSLTLADLASRVAERSNKA